MSDTRRPADRMADAAIAVARHAARLGLGPDAELAEALPGAVERALDERHALREEVARLRPLLSEAFCAVPHMVLSGGPKPLDHDDWQSLMGDIVVALHGPRGDDAEDRPCCVECGCSVRLYTAVERGGEWYCAMCLNGDQRLPDEMTGDAAEADLARLRAVAESEGGDGPPTDTAWRLASLMASAAAKAGYPVRDLGASPDGGVVLYLSVPRPWKCEMECYNAGEIVGLVAPGPRAQAEFWTSPGTAAGVAECIERVRAALAAAAETPDGNWPVGGTARGR